MSTVQLNGTGQLGATATNPAAPWSIPFSWTRYPRIAWEGWLAAGADWEPTDPGVPSWATSVPLQCYSPGPLFIPADAGPQPSPGARYLVVRDLGWDGWPQGPW
jgi:hypothetical protein